MPKPLFTGDLHFGHRNIINLCNRPFSSIEEMNNCLIHNWNSRVTDDTDVYILGDFAHHLEFSVSKYLDKLKGRKHLIVGNHDTKWMKNVANMGKYFESVSDLEYLELDNKLITLCHYPMLEWMRSRYNINQDDSKAFLIHGHIHNKRDNVTYQIIKEYLPCALNAGVDINGFMPVTFEELLINNNIWYERI